MHNSLIIIQRISYI